MKRIMFILLLSAMGCALTAGAIYADDNKTTDVTASVGSVFGLAFYTEANKVLYSTSVPFSNVNPANDYNYADTRVENDGKSDVGLIVRSNDGNIWYFKMSVNAASTLAGKIGAFMGQPTNRNVLPNGAPTDGARTYNNWFDLKTTAETVYTAGVLEKTNTPFGTLITLSYKINGGGLAATDYTATVTYTLTPNA